MVLHQQVWGTAQKDMQELWLCVHFMFMKAFSVTNIP